MEQLSLLDGAVFGATLATTVLIGHHFGLVKPKQQQQQQQANGRPSIWLVAASSASAFVNAPTMIGFPNELYLHGPSFALAQFLASALSFPLCALLLLPAFSRFAPGPAVLQFVEARFGPHLRRLIAALFVLMTTLYQACALFVPALALNTMLEVPKLASVLLVALPAALHAIYGPNTSARGAHCLNLFHTSLMCLLMATILAGGLLKAGGLGQVLTTNMEDGRLSLPSSDFLHLDLATRHTVFNSALGLTLLRTFLHGINPGQVQAALSLQSVKRGQVSQLLAFVIFLIVQTLATSAGLVFYTQFKGCDPHLSGEIDRRETALMHFIKSELHFIPALRGIFLASTFSSTFSGLSTFLSSTPHTIYNELVMPFLRPTSNEKDSFKSGAISQEKVIKRALTLLLTLVCIFTTIFVIDQTNHLLQFIYTLFAVYSGPIVACFFLGLSTKLITNWAMFAGCLVSLALGVYIQFYQAFIGPPTKPTLSIVTDTCPRVTSVQFKDFLEPAQYLPKGLLQISYFWLPFVLALVASLVAFAISIVTHLLTPKRQQSNKAQQRTQVFTIGHHKEAKPNSTRQ